jgi:hypothetical protein
MATTAADKLASLELEYAELLKSETRPDGTVMAAKDGVTNINAKRLMNMVLEMGELRDVLSS